MKISVFGLGYVGAVSAACLAELGHEVTGVDISRQIIDNYNSGAMRFAEAGLAELTAKHMQSGRLKVTSDDRMAVLGSAASMICVGTPSRDGGDTDYSSLEKVCESVGKTLSGKKGFYAVIVRSTVFPGTLRNLVIPLLERISGKKAGKDFGVCHNPEFLREGSAIDDFRHPSRTVIGATDERCGDIAQKIYESLPAEVIRCSVETSEMVKYTDNAWHAAKVVFANETGALCKSLGIDSHAVMDIFCRDTKLNLSPSYLKPGFAFGGSCLPKDLRALNYHARQSGIKTPLLDSLLASNRGHIRSGLDLILAAKKKSIGFLGLSFKAGTDDLRESPLTELVRQLLEKGYDVKIYDSHVNISALSDANRDYMLRILPGIERLLVNTIDEALRDSEVLVIGNRMPEIASVAKRLRPGQTVIDFVRVRAIEEAHPDYHGICW